MRITVFGASGHIGGEMVRQAAAAGHEVTAVVRAGPADPPDGVEVARVPDLTVVEALLPVVEGADAVVSGIGPRGSRQVRVASSTGAAILRALDKTGVRRFVAVT